MAHPSTQLHGGADEQLPVGVYPPSRRGNQGRLIGEIAVELGFVDRETVETVVEQARGEGKTTGQALVESGALGNDQLARVIAERFGIDYVDLTAVEVDLAAMALLDPEVAKRYQAAPIVILADGTLLVAMADPNNILTVDDIAMITGFKVRPAAASREDLRTLLSNTHRAGEALEDISDIDFSDVDDEMMDIDDVDAENAPIIKLVHSIIAQAIEQGASDIHFSPEEGEMRVMFRIDGVLFQTATIRRRMQPGVVSRIKIMGELDISEKIKPQDGRITLMMDGRRVDLRAVTLPVVGGEAVVLRILDRGVVLRDLDSMGMLGPEKERFADALKHQHGAVLVTGPTGSGKSTTLYAALGTLNTGDRSILTIEDPVESPIAGVKQMQVQPKRGVTFAVGLRTMMRADPDVIMVGEIRDRETAQIAIEAALTGHLVLSTLHTRDAPGALTRLVDMGIAPFLVVSSVDCVVAQRLARTLCESCKVQSQLPDDVLAKYGLEGVQPYEAMGCARCGKTGYRGRIGLYEVMTITEEIRKAVIAGATSQDIADIAVSQGMRRLRDDGFAKVRLGETSLAEIERVTAQ
jgi:type IV pilus assembly protein PilB